MTQTQIANILKDMYNSAPVGEKTVQIHLFGIIFANEIRDNKFRLAYIIQIAGLRKTLDVEISDGIKLSQYVQVNPEILTKYTPPK